MSGLRVLFLSFFLSISSSWTPVTMYSLFCRGKIVRGKRRTMSLFTYEGQWLQWRAQTRGQLFLVNGLWYSSGDTASFSCLSCHDWCFGALLMLPGLGGGYLRDLFYQADDVLSRTLMLKQAMLPRFSIHTQFSLTVAFSDLRAWVDLVLWSPELLSD